MQKTNVCLVLCLTFLGLSTVTFGKEVVLTKMLDGYYDEYNFASSGNQVLLVDIDATVYQTHGRGKTHDHDDHDNHDTEATTASDDVHTDDDHGGGCSGSSGGPTSLCVQVVDDTETVLCWADRPNFPGWMRDPQMVCVLPEGSKQTYAVRVFLKAEGENCGSAYYSVDADQFGPGKRLYVMKIMLKDVAEEGRIKALEATQGKFD